MKPSGRTSSSCKTNTTTTNTNAKKRKIKNPDKHKTFQLLNFHKSHKKGGRKIFDQTLKMNLVHFFLLVCLSESPFSRGAEGNKTDF